MRNLFGITLFENDLYVTNWRNESVYRINKYTGDSVVALKSNQSRPFSIHAYHRQRQPEGPSKFFETSFRSFFLFVFLFTFLFAFLFAFLYAFLYAFLFAFLLQLGEMFLTTETIKKLESRTRRGNLRKKEINFFLLANTFSR